MYVLDSNTDDAEDDAYEWTADFQDFMKDQNEEYESTIGIEYITSRSIEDALTESVSGEAFLFVITCAYLFCSWLLVTVALIPNPQFKTYS